MLFIQLLFLLATIGSYLSEAKPYVYEKPTKKCDKSDLYSTLPDGTIKDSTYDCNRYWLCMKMAEGNYDWVLEKCMGNLHYDGTACSVGTTPSTGCVKTTTAPPYTGPSTTKPPTTKIPETTCDEKESYKTKAAAECHHYWLCMKSSSGYEWVYEKCMGTLVYDPTQTSCQLPSDKDSCHKKAKIVKKTKHAKIISKKTHDIEPTT